MALPTQEELKLLANEISARDRADAARQAQLERDRNRVETALICEKLTPRLITEIERKIVEAANAGWTKTTFVPGTLPSYNDTQVENKRYRLILDHVVATFKRENPKYFLDIWSSPGIVYGLDGWMHVTVEAKWDKDYS